MVGHKNIIGNTCEQKACAFLETKGLTLITKNYRSTFGEIDLIMRHDEKIVFIEVRSRSKKEYGSAIESINHTKQKKIFKTSLFFLQKKNLLNKVDCRFDVIGIDLNHIEWIQDAFCLDIL